MNGLYPSPIKKLRIILLSFLILLVFRQDSWLANLDVNFTLLELNRYPIWRAIVENDLPLLSSSLTRSNNFGANNVTLAREQGLLVFVEGQETKAIEIWQTAGLLPAEVMALKARYALAMNHQNIALAWYEQGVEFDPLLESAWQALGKLYAQNGRMNSAIVAYEQAIHLGDATSVALLAKLSRDKGDHLTAIEVWQFGINTFPDSSERLQWWQGLTNSLRATEQWVKGRASIELALLEFPNDAQLYVEQAFILYSLTGDVDQAEKSLIKASTIDNELASTYVVWGKIMDAESRYKEAVAWYSKAIALNSNRLWHLNRAQSSLNSGDIEMSIALYKNAILQFPDFSTAHFELAAIYKLNNEPNKAIETIEMAILLNRVDVNYYLRAGEIYEWNNNPSKAISAYQIALTIDENNAIALERLNRLKNQ